MTNQVVLGVLELLAIASCCFGTYYVYQDISSWLKLGYSGAWFIFGLFSNFFGLLSIYNYYVEKDDELDNAHYYLQIHYLFAWVTTVIGYPTLVALTVLTHYPTPYAHLISGLIILPLIAYYMRDNDWIVYMTQAAIGISIFCHFYICYLADNFYGMIGAGIMVGNLIALSTPTRFNFLGISSRECFIIGLAACSYCFAQSVSFMSKKPPIVHNLTPWL